MRYKFLCKYRDWKPYTSVLDDLSDAEDAFDECKNGAPGIEPGICGSILDTQTGVVLKSFGVGCLTNGTTEPAKIVQPSGGKGVWVLLGLGLLGYYLWSRR